MLLEIRSILSLSHFVPLYVMMILCFLATVTGFLTAFRKKKKPYLKWLAIYCFLSLLQTLLCLLHFWEKAAGRPFPPIHTVSANIFMVIEFIIINRYFSRTLYSPLAKKIAKGVLVAFLIYCIVYWTWINSFLDFAYGLYVIEALCIFPFCLYYFYELFGLPYLLDLAQESPFWINIGMLFYFMCFVPLFMFSSFPVLNQSDTLEYVIIFSYGLNSAFCAMMIKGFLCTNPKEKIYRATAHLF